MEENHKKFLSHLKKSSTGVFAAAGWLWRRGNTVTIRQHKLAPSHDQWKDYVDEGDLEVSFRAEVKHLQCEFTGSSDWPYTPYFIVCAKHAWDNAFPKPKMFIYLSKTMEYLAVVEQSSSCCWYVEKRKDYRYEGIEQECYFVPLDHVTFFKNE